MKSSIKCYPFIDSFLLVITMILGLGAAPQQLVKDSNTGASTCNSSPGYFQVLGGSVIFSATDGIRELNFGKAMARRTEQPS